MPSGRFARQGGRITRYPNAQWLGDYYSIPDIAQSRDLTKYDLLELRDRENRHPWERSRDQISAQARSFLWEHWRNKKRAYLILTTSSVDHTGTSHIFLEPDDAGRWRVYWRQLDRHELVDAPTAYSVAWISGRMGRSTPLPSEENPDPLTDELQFRDICGEESENI